VDCEGEPVSGRDTGSERALSLRSVRAERDIPLRCREPTEGSRLWVTSSAPTTSVPSSRSTSAAGLPFVSTSSQVSEATAVPPSTTTSLRSGPPGRTLWRATVSEFDCHIKKKKPGVRLGANLEARPALAHGCGFRPERVQALDVSTIAPNLDDAHAESLKLRKLFSVRPLAISRHRSRGRGR
jgi:hypothetical protein